MEQRRFDTFDHMTHTAYSWLADVADALGTHDRRYAYRVLRAWLHGLRDRLTAECGAQFAAQLPELIRGVYFDGWNPSRVPVKYGPQEYTQRFASHARISTSDVPSAAAAVSAALRRRLSPGQLDTTLARLPGPLGELVAGTRGMPAADAVPPAGSQKSDDRIVRLESQVATLIDAVRALTDGLEDVPVGARDEHRAARAARLAHEMLLAGKT